jgi:hypothetical protein
MDPRRAERTREASIPRVAAPRGTVGSGESLASGLRLIGKVGGGLLGGLSFTVAALARVLFVVLYGAAAVALIQAGQVPVGLGCAAYALYLAFGGRWFIW